MDKKTISFISLKLCREKEIIYEPKRIKKAEDCISLLFEIIGDSAKEQFIILALNSQNEPNAIEICSMGTSEMALVHPREVFKTALLCNAVKIIIAHNHPSGSVKPSEEDIRMTKHLILASEILGVPILDHIIVGNHRYFSFAESGIIPR